MTREENQLEDSYMRDGSRAKKESNLGLIKE